MSICVYGRINKKCIDENCFEKMLVDFFLPKNDIIKKNNKESVTYEEISDGNQIIISFVNEKKPPYNVYDSSIINDEYEYMQLIIFDIMKEEASIDKYKTIINFCVYLKQKIESAILITSDVYDEICLLKEQDVIWSKNFTII